MQSIFRVQKNKDNPYVMLNKEFLNNQDLSLKAKGLLAYLLSLPDDWQIYESEIVKHHSDGKDSLRSAIKELIDSGYILRERIRNEKGQLQGSNYLVYEVPTYSGKSNIGKPATTNNNITNKQTGKYKHQRHRKDDTLSDYQAKQTSNVVNMLMQNKKLEEA